MKRNIDAISDAHQSQTSESQSKILKDSVHLLSIPIDCIRIIFSLLNTLDFHSFSATCKTLYKTLGNTLENSYNLITNDIFYKHRLYDVLHHSGSSFQTDMDSEYRMISRLKDIMEKKMEQIHSAKYFVLMKASLHSNDLKFLIEIKKWQLTRCGDDVIISFIWEHLHEKHGLRSVSFSFHYRSCFECGNPECDSTGFFVKAFLLNGPSTKFINFFEGGGCEFIGLGNNEYDNSYDSGNAILKFLGIKMKEMHCLGLIHFVFRLCMLDRPTKAISIKDNYHDGFWFPVCRYGFDEYQYDDVIVNFDMDYDGPTTDHPSQEW